MRFMRRNIDRRTFLKGAAAVAGLSVAGALGCEAPDGTGQPDSASDDTGATDTDTAGKSREGSVLFSPARIGGVELKNRLVRSATEEAYMDLGRPTDEFTEIFTNLAAGGIGAIISGIAMVSQNDAVPFELYAYEDGYIAGFKKIREAVRAVDADCKVFAQVGHTGHRYHTGLRIGPSSKSWPGDVFPMRALKIEEIPLIVEDFAQAVRRFQEGGWDGVELHGAHGYLLSSFLSPYTNERTDRYGGGVPQRVQIIREIIERSRKLVGDEFPIFIKINCNDSGGNEPDDLQGGIDRPIFLETASELAKLKIDAIDVSGNDFSQVGISDPQDQSYFKQDVIALDVEIPLILTGGNRRADDLNAILETNEVDFIGLSRPLIREPDLANKWRSGQTDETACISCNRCTEIANLVAGLRCHQSG